VIVMQRKVEVGNDRPGPFPGYLHAESDLDRNDPDSRIQPRRRVGWRSEPVCLSWNSTTPTPTPTSSRGSSPTSPTRRLPRENPREDFGEDVRFFLSFFIEQSYLKDLLDRFLRFFFRKMEGICAERGLCARFCHVLLVVACSEY